MPECIKLALNTNISPEYIEIGIFYYINLFYLIFFYDYMVLFP